MSNTPSGPPYRTAPPVPQETFWTTFRRVSGTRKGFAAIVSTVGALFFVLAVTVSYFQGKMTTDAYWTKLQVAGGLVTGVWSIYIGGTAYEDGNKAPQNVQTVTLNPEAHPAEVAPPTAQAAALTPDTMVTLIPAETPDESPSEPSTPAETPDAKRVDAAGSASVKS